MTSGLWDSFFKNRTMTQNTPPGCVRAIWPRRRVMECCIRWPGLHITQPQPNWDGLGWVGPQSEGKAANKCSACVETPLRLLEKHSRWSWLRECQECAKLSSRQRVATLKNLMDKIYFDLFFFGYYMIPYVLFHSFDVFTIILHCRK